MPTRTEIVITIGEVLECLPPGKAFKRRRYNSFDANTVGNEENLAPGREGRQVMKPVKLEAEDDDEVSFRTSNGDSESRGSKPKRKTSAEKFLEDNANYFQLEVLSSKTRSNKRVSDNGVFGVEDESKEAGFHNSFLDFLKSKGVEKETLGRSRHKSAESELGREGRSRTAVGRSHSSHSPYHRSRSTNREYNGSSKSRGRSISKNKVGANSLDQSASESESDTKVNVTRAHRRGRKAREVSPSGSEAESLSSRPASRRSRRGKAFESEASSDEESKSRASSPLTKPSPRKKRSELDKLLEAVDTSFHFETAAAERKRLSDSGLGPLEIDCSDTGSEASCNVGSKRKASECHLESDDAKIKKQKVGNNLLKTASPGDATRLKSEAPSCSGSESEFDGSGSTTAWDGWDLLADQLQSITHSPVEIDRLHFSFETEPVREGWYSTYQRQDKGDEIVFYPSSTSAPFLLPYEMPYANFLPGRSGDKTRRDETPLGSRPQSKAASPVRQAAASTSTSTSTRKAKSRKVSETDSTDSEDLKRGRGGRAQPKAKPTVIPFPAHLQEPNYRVSPRQHASTKAILIGSEEGGTVGELEDLQEAYIMRDEAELHFPNLNSYLGAEDSNDSYSSESLKSRVIPQASRAPDTTVPSEMSSLASSIDRMMGDLPLTTSDDSNSAAKLPPTRSRVSSDQLLSPKKMKKKKKLQPESVSPMDQYVADSVDPVLLDLLEDELPTVPLDEVSEPLELLETYTRCTSMAVCNKRWLKPSKMDAVIPMTLAPSVSATPGKPKRRFIFKDDLPGFSIDSDMEAEKLPVSKRRLKEEAKVESKVKVEEKVTKDESESEEDEPVKPKKRGPSPSKKVADPTKPKRIIIYKDDLPGFEVLPDSDVESEKMPVSKRGGKPGPKPGKKKFKVKEVEDEEDNVSVESFSSTSSGPKKKKRKMNLTGFPSPKKKKPSPKKEASTPSPGEKHTVKINLKSPKSASKTASSPEKSTKPDIETVKKKVPKQIKLDRFITKTSKSKSIPPESTKPGTDISRRSATLKTKNYSELESDTESLLEMPVGTPASMAASLPKKLRVDLGPMKTTKKK